MCLLLSVWGVPIRSGNKHTRLHFSFVTVFFVAGLLETEATLVTGELRREVRIKCSHTNAFSNIKYFCKGRCDDKDVLIRSSEKKTNSKYSISDEGNTFYVTISHLAHDDSGTYWCGIERVGVDTFNKVILTVVDGELINVFHFFHTKSPPKKEEEHSFFSLQETQRTQMVHLDRFQTERKRHPVRTGLV